MKTPITFIAVMALLSTCSVKQGKAEHDSIVATAKQAEDTIDTGKSLNDIRFDGLGK